MSWFENKLTRNNNEMRLQVTLKAFLLLSIVRGRSISIIKKYVSQTDFRIEMPAKVILVPELFLAVCVRTGLVGRLGVPDYHVPSHVAAIGGLLATEAAQEDFRTVGICSSLQVLHYSAQAWNRKCKELQKKKIRVSQKFGKKIK